MVVVSDLINDADIQLVLSSASFLGINLTSQAQGLFPSVYATDLEFYEINDGVVKQQPTKLYKLHFLGSMEVNHHKGSTVLVDAIERVRQITFYISYHIVRCVHRKTVEE